MIRRVEAAVDVMRNGAICNRLDFPEPPTVLMSADASIKMSFTGKFLHNADVDYLNDRLCPRLVINEVDYPLGVYVIATVAGKYENGTLYDRIEAFDQALILQQTKTEDRLFFAAGTTYLSAVSSLLTGAGVQSVISDQLTDALQTDREDWEIGTDYLQIINAMLAEINYSPIWFDLNGAARLHKYRVPSGESVDIAYTSGVSNIKSECTSELDVYNAPNVFMAIMDNPDYDEVIIKTAENNNLASALSIPRRGRRILRVERVDNIASADALQDYANNLCLKAMQTTETIQFETDLNPVHTVGNIVGLDHEYIKGVYEERYWSMPLMAGATMFHKARKVAYL